MAPIAAKKEKDDAVNGRKHQAGKKPWVRKQGVKDGATAQRCTDPQAIKRSTDQGSIAHSNGPPSYFFV